MLSIQLNPISQAEEDEVEMYYQVEEKMVQSGDLKISRDELYNEIDTHHSIHLLKTHEHFHIFSFLTSIFIYYIAYEFYVLYAGPSVVGATLTILATLMLALSWIVAHPTLKHENLIKDYYRSHRLLFYYNKDHCKISNLK